MVISIKKLIIIIFVSTLSISAVISGIRIVGMGERNRKINLNNTFKNDAYEISIPNDWNTKESPSINGNINFERKGKRIGGVDVLECIPTKFLGDSLRKFYNIEIIVDESCIDGFSIDVRKVKLVQKHLVNHTYVAEQELHICYIDRSYNRVYDVNFQSSVVDEETALNVFKTFKLGIWDMVKNARPIENPNSWIISTKPQSHSKCILPSTGIDIVFKYDMDERSLNEDTIIVNEVKYNRIISRLLNYEYDTHTRTLHLSFIQSGNSFGSGNSINVYITGKVSNSHNHLMGKTYYFGFTTK